MHSLALGRRREWRQAAVALVLCPGCCAPPLSLYCQQAATGGGPRREPVERRALQLWVVDGPAPRPPDCTIWVCRLIGGGFGGHPGQHPTYSTQTAALDCGRWHASSRPCASLSRLRAHLLHLACPPAHLAAMQTCAVLCKAPAGLKAGVPARQRPQRALVRAAAGQQTLQVRLDHREAPACWLEPADRSPAPLLACKGSPASILGLPGADWVLQIGCRACCRSPSCRQRGGAVGPTCTPSLLARPCPPTAGCGSEDRHPGRHVRGSHVRWQCAGGDGGGQHCGQRQPLRHDCPAGRARAWGK